MKIFAKLLITTFFISTGLLLSTRSVGAFGISPASLYNERLRPGQVLEQEFVISKAADEGELEVIIEPDLNEFSQWFEFSPSKKFIFPANQSQMKIKTTVKVPSDANLKSYSGFIRVKAATPEAENTGVSIVKGVRMDVDLVATDLVVSDLKVLNMYFDDVTKGSALKLNLKIQNEGNVKSAPSRIEVEVFNLNQESIGILETNSAPEVDAWQTAEVSADIPLTISLGIGEYIAKVKVLYGDNVLRNEKLILRILEPTKSTASTKTMRPNEDTVSNVVKIVAIALFSIGLLMIILLLLSYRHKTNSKSKTVLYLILAIVPIVAGTLLYTQRVWVTDAYYKLTTEEKVSQELVENNKESETNVKDTAVKGVETILINPENIKTKTFAPLEVKGTTDEAIYEVFEDPDMNSKVITYAKEGEIYTVIEELSNWYRIDLNDGIDGWIQKDNIRAKEVTETP